MEEMNILMYHRFGINPEDLYCRSARDFYYDLHSFSQYKITDPYEMDGEVIITIDDGDISCYEMAYLLLRGFDYPAVFFIITNFIGKKGYMSWKQVKELSQYFCIESHTHNHFILKPMSEKEIEYELKTSRDLIAEKTGKEPQFLSLPGGRGEGDKTIIRIAKKLGYKGIFTSAIGSNEPLDMYYLRRLPLSKKNHEKTNKKN